MDQSVIFILEYWAIGLGSLADWTFGRLLYPLRYALFMVHVLAPQLDQLLILLKLTVADRADVFLVFILLLVVPLISYPLQTLYFFFA
jgi:hypothetical protein